MFCFLVYFFLFLFGFFLTFVPFLILSFAIFCHYDILCVPCFSILLDRYLRPYFYGFSLNFIDCLVFVSLFFSFHFRCEFFFKTFYLIYFMNDGLRYYPFAIIIDRFCLSLLDIAKSLFRRSRIPDA